MSGLEKSGTSGDSAETLGILIASPPYRPEGDSFEFGFVIKLSRSMSSTKHPFAPHESYHWP